MKNQVFYKTPVSAPVCVEIEKKVRDLKNSSKVIIFSKKVKYEARKSSLKLLVFVKKRTLISAGFLHSAAHQVIKFF